MKRKIVIGLAMLIVLTVSLSAQEGFMYEFEYVSNLSEQQFTALKDMIYLTPGMYAIEKLPNPVIQTINNVLRDYTLDTGDIFRAWVIYQRIGYSVWLRITDGRNSRWQFYALRQY